MNPTEIYKEMENLYLNDKRPWIIGLSGGKDSTCVTQMVYYMLQNLHPEKSNKEVHVLSADTLVESPIIELRIKNICRKIEKQAKKDELPITVKILRPLLNDTFWVNLIGRGYPSPNRWFRWCTDRLKIYPMTKYIIEQVKENGEVIILLGARKTESGSRAQTMGKYEIEDFGLRKHSSIPGAYIYTPIEDWDYRDVWAYLLQVQSPWGDNNRDLITFYRKVDRECPLVIDKSTPACGGSRFGCWVCTVVERDRALEGLIEDGEAWLGPLLEFRNWLKEIRNDPNYREGTRKNSKKREVVAKRLGREYTLPEHRGHKILGPFTFETRHEILRRLIKLQEQIMGREIPLISPEEIKAIETIWIYEGDNISSIADVLDFPKMNDFTAYSPRNNMLGLEQLSKICDKNRIPARLIEQLLIVEKDLSSLSRRTGIYDRLEKVIEEHVINEMAAENGV
ncbi:DNA phosphorothioation system sulfurtransferase DndC [candidate division KSB1 bacterium]|nr:DNA phosphorothioation system sulfurtransferase DndC [candidate division KSB1 bacterium]